MLTFTEICQKLMGIDCSFKRYCKPEIWAAGEQRQYDGMTGRQENQFEYIHELIAAMQAGNQQKIKENWHILSDGQIQG